MDLNLLKTFDVVMKTRSVNEAAETLGITAPAVSHALNRLREQYQDPLFIRQGRGITPTNFAIELHAEIQEPLSLLLNGAKSRQQFNPDTSHRTFRLSSHKDIDLMLLPPLMDHLAQHAPNVKLCADVEHLDERDRQADLRTRKVDMILATVPFDEHGYHNELLFELPLVMVCSQIIHAFKTPSLINSFLPSSTCCGKPNGKTKTSWTHWRWSHNHKETSPIKPVPAATPS